MVKRLFWAALLLALLLVGCNRDDKQEQPPDTVKLLADAAQKLDEARSFQLALEVTGAPILLDSSKINMDVTLTLQRAEGVFVRPDTLQANVTILMDDIAAEVELIAVGQDQYLRHPIITLGQWQALKFSEGFNPASLVTGDDSIANALRAIQNVAFVGEETLDGLPVYHLKGEVDAARVEAVTVGLIGTKTGTVKVDLYIRVRDGLLEELRLEEPIKPEVDANQPSVWKIGLYDYNGDYTVSRPEVSQ